MDSCVPSLSLSLSLYKSTNHSSISFFLFLSIYLGSFALDVIRSGKGKAGDNLNLPALLSGLGNFGGKNNNHLSSNPLAALGALGGGMGGMASKLGIPNH